MRKAWMSVGRSCIVLSERKRYSKQGLTKYDVNAIRIRCRAWGNIVNVPSSGLEKIFMHSQYLHLWPKRRSYTYMLFHSVWNAPKCSIFMKKSNIFSGGGMAHFRPYPLRVSVTSPQNYSYAIVAMRCCCYFTAVITLARLFQSYCYLFIITAKGHWWPLTGFIQTSWFLMQ